MANNPHIAYNSLVNEDVPPSPLHAMPPGAAQPRFINASQYEDVRQSFASASQQSLHGQGSEYNSSVYALNDPTSYSGQQGSGYYDATIPPPSPTAPREMTEKHDQYAPPQAKSRRKIMVIGAIIAAILLLAAIIVPVYLFVIKPNGESTSGSSSSTKGGSTTGAATGTASTSAAPTASATPVTGGDGSIITMEDGTTFTYKNPHGGYWYWDEKDPFNNGARPQSWSPALNETFRYGADLIRGVNIGGWLNTEPFISPALYEKYQSLNPSPVDEWMLSERMRADTAGGGIGQLEEHYKTFITERDFAEIAAAGLNYVRIPIGYWAIEVWEGEPFLEKVSWTYFLKAIKWARKYGLRINLDLHAVPGSQNGWNHSGKFGTMGWLYGPMGYANAQRSLDYIRIIAEFISQPQYKDVVTMFGIINEPLGHTSGMENLQRFYVEAYKIIRRAGGTGAGNGPWISFHDGFSSRSQWASFLRGGDRITLDTHPYLCFNSQRAGDIASFATTPCDSWAGLVTDGMRGFGMLNAGEFSNAVNDCGLFLNGVNLGTRYEGTYEGVWPRIGDCRTWTDWQNYTPAMKTGLRNFAMASMDALQNYFFWTWKIGDSLVSGKVETPAWSYKLGLDNGWMPTDPRSAAGYCKNPDPFVGPLPAWQTGGVGAGMIAAAETANLAWPPLSMSAGGAVVDLPAYTPTGVISTLPVPTFTATVNGQATTFDAGNGWANAADNTPMYRPVPTCTYLDPWVRPNTAPPPACGIARREAAPEPLITQAPGL